MLKKDHLTELVYTFESVLLNVIEWSAAFVILVSISTALSNSNTVSPFLLLLYDTQKENFKYCSNYLTSSAVSKSLLLL